MQLNLHQRVLLKQIWKIEKKEEKKSKSKSNANGRRIQNDMSTTLYEETKKQIQNADVSKELEDKPKRRITRKKCLTKEWRKIQYGKKKIKHMRYSDKNMERYKKI